MRFYNSLNRSVEVVEPIEPSKVRVYTCGPTVYFYPHIGNWRTFFLGDVLVRTLKYLGYEIEYVMNITDVGHLTGDNVGDASSGEDRLEKASRREGKTAWDVAQFYTQDFLAGYRKLNLTEPKIFSKATDHIEEQISLIKKIEEAGFTYAIGDGVYFDVGAYEKAGHEYGLMSNIHIDDAQERIAENTEKKDKRDFALWKFSPSGEERQMEWKSPWGTGFPGWHIECSAMSIKYLGEQFDIHVGGEDHKSTHHPNEIAQSEAATGKKPFVKYWVHGAFLTVDGGRMGKSLGNAYTLQDIENKGFLPVHMRYFYMSGHYRKQLNFTWEALGAAKQAHTRLLELMRQFREEKERVTLSEEKLQKVNDYRAAFKAALENDLAMPEALAVAWEVVKSNIPGTDKFDLLREFDEVLGLGLGSQSVVVSIPEPVMLKAEARKVARAGGNFEEADRLRAEIAKAGFVVEDTDSGPKLKPIG
jgi:cysteinyl-tRNA synthetase